MRIDRHGQQHDAQYFSAVSPDGSDSRLFSKTLRRTPTQAFPSPTKEAGRLNQCISRGLGMTAEIISVSLAGSARQPTLPEFPWR